MNAANRNLILRFASAAVLIPVLLALILNRRPEPFAIFIHLAVVLGLHEFYGIVLRDDPPWLRFVGVLGGLCVSVAMYWSTRPEAVLAVLIVAAVASALLHLIRVGEVSTAPARSGLMVFGLLYLPLFLTPLALLKRRPDGAAWILLIATITWLSDTGAYFAGRAMGRHKLYPIVSPGKTVEGAIGGLASSLAAAILAKLWYMPQLGWTDVLLTSLVGGALGQGGDLVESLFKRGYGVKDSGRLIPGHGGLLDRIDALLFCTPYIYLYASYAM